VAGLFNNWQALVLTNRHHRRPTALGAIGRPAIFYHTAPTDPVNFPNGPPPTSSIPNNPVDDTRNTAPTASHIGIWLCRWVSTVFTPERLGQPSSSPDTAGPAVQPTAPQRSSRAGHNLPGRPRRLSRVGATDRHLLWGRSARLRPRCRTTAGPTPDDGACCSHWPSMQAVCCASPAARLPALATEPSRCIFPASGRTQPRGARVRPSPAFRAGKAVRG